MKIFSSLIIYQINITNKQIDSESLAEKSKVIICMKSLAWNWQQGHKVIFLNFKLFNL